MEMATALGYACFAARGSRGPVDVICFVDHFRHLRGEDTGLPPLVIQVGTAAKSIKATLPDLWHAPRPIGSLCVVARRHRAKNRRVSWTWHSYEGKFESLEALLKGK